MGLRPSHECPTGEFRAVVGTYHLGVAAKGCRLLEQARDVLAGDAEVVGDIDALMAEVVGNGQTFDPSAIDQAIADKIHAPHLIHGRGNL